MVLERILVSYLSHSYSTKIPVCGTVHSFSITRGFLTDPIMVFVLPLQPQRIWELQEEWSTMSKQMQLQIKSKWKWRLQRDSGELLFCRGKGRQVSATSHQESLCTSRWADPEYGPRNKKKTSVGCFFCRSNFVGLGVSL